MKAEDERGSGNEMSAEVSPDAQPAGVPMVFGSCGRCYYCIEKFPDMERYCIWNNQKVHRYQRTCLALNANGRPLFKWFR